MRSARALWLFLTVFLSYGVQWVLWRASARRGFATRWDRVHVKNARRLANGFSHLRGVYIKMGQVLSVLGTFLPEAYSEALRALQDSVPHRPFPEVRSRLTSAWGEEPNAKFSHIDEEPIAAASLAQVHRATLATGEEVAIKILYPGIEELVQRDLGVVRLVLPIVHRVFGFRQMSTVLEQLTQMLEHEMDYDHERLNLMQFHSMFGERDDVVIPRPFVELCGAGVLVMTFERGSKLTDPAALSADGIDPEVVARTLVECYLTMLFEHRVFHADPHPGNFLAKPGNQLVFLDFGAVEPLDENLVEGMKTVLFGGLTRNADQVLAGIEQMGFVAKDGDRALLERVGREYLRNLSQLKITDFSSIEPAELKKLVGLPQLQGRLRDIAGSLHYPNGYFYVERTLVLLFGLVGKLVPGKGLLGVGAPFASKILLRDFVKRPDSKARAKVAAATVDS